MVLEALCRPPFEPIEEISDRLLTLKTIFLLAISSPKSFWICRPFLWPLPISTLRPVLPKLFCTLVRGMSLRSPPLHHGLSYFRLFVLLPSGSLTSRGLIVCVHWTHTSTELPCGEGRTNCLFAMVPLSEVILLPSRLSAGG